MHSWNGILSRIKAIKILALGVIEAEYRKASGADGEIDWPDRPAMDEAAAKARAWQILCDETDHYGYPRMANRMREYGKPLTQNEEISRNAVLAAMRAVEAKVRGGK